MTTLLDRTEIIRQYYDTWPVHIPDGCDMAWHCEDCPLRQCRLDDRSWFDKGVRYTRYHIMVEVWKQCHYDTQKAARLLGVHWRSVCRADTYIRRFQGLLTDAEIRAFATQLEPLYWDWAVYLIGAKVPDE